MANPYSSSADYILHHDYYTLWMTTWLDILKNHLIIVQILRQLINKINKWLFLTKKLVIIGTIVYTWKKWSA